MALEVFFLLKLGEILLEEAIDVFGKVLVLLERSCFEDIIEADVKFRLGGWDRFWGVILHSCRVFF